jgi:Fic family protein
MKDFELSSKALNDPLITGEVDRGENCRLMEPMLPAPESSDYQELADLALELSMQSASLKSGVPPAFLKALAGLVRAMNCYYSNLIEGHDTHPIDIERALKKDYSADPIRRNLQLEAEAHVAVQEWIDQGGLAGKSFACSSIIEVHKRFCELLPQDLLSVQDPETKKRVSVVPGQIRLLDTQVGNHIAVSPGAVPRFLARYESVYSGLGKSQKIISAASSHHRLLWIHPFIDGNGRVARLLSHALFLETVDTGGIWSVARGLARQQQEYKSHLMECDQSRRGDLDGRGVLSASALSSFTRFFLQICLDQVAFMRSLIRPDLLRERVLNWAKEESAVGSLPPRSTALLESILLVGELKRADIQSLLEASPATARRVVSALTEKGVLVSDSTRAPVRLAFPATLASRWLPGLFPDK